MRELETERLRLRALRSDDVQAIFDGWASDPEVTRYLTWNPPPKPGSDPDYHGLLARGI